MSPAIELVGTAALILAMCFGFAHCNAEDRRGDWFRACMEQRRGYLECKP